MHDQGTTTITVDFAMNPGEISVLANAPCPGDPRLLTVTFLNVAAIDDQPSPASACTGGAASFNVSASGAVLSYQWRKDGSDLPGQTAATLNLSGISSSDAGSYDCVVNGLCNSVTSASALLTVWEMVNFSQQHVAASSCVGDAATFAVVASGTAPLSYQWYRNGTPLAGHTTASITLDPISAADAGNYHCVGSNLCGSTPSSPALLTVEELAITGQPSSASACPGGTASFSVSASGQGLSYQWRKGGIDLFGQTTATLNLSGIGSADAGSYDCVVNGSCGSAISASAMLVVEGEVAITSQPNPTSACPGGAASFSVSASGSGLSYQWRKNGFNLIGQTATTLNLSGIVSADAGSYDCVVSGSCGSATSASATLVVEGEVAITGQPNPTSACPGAAAFFTVSTAGPGLSYQWRKGGFDLPGQNAATLGLTGITAADAGSYDCVVSSACGSATSASAALTVWESVAFSQHPHFALRCVGDAVTFEVFATGSEPIAFQWYGNGLPLTGRTAASLTIDPIAATDAGHYHCQAFNFCGSAVSGTALLALESLGTNLNRPAAAQGIHYLVLDGGPLCGIPEYEVQWTNLTSGYAYPIDENPITLAPVLSETSTFEFRVTDGRSRATTTTLVPILVHHFDLLDWDGNGCSEQADLWQAIQFWRSTYPDDPNDDGFLDIRDFLYINTDGCP